MEKMGVDPMNIVQITLSSDELCTVDMAPTNGVYLTVNFAALSSEDFHFIAIS